MTTVAWWHCFAGIAGDMALASLLDAGADVAEVVAGLEGLPVKGWSVEATRSTSSGLGATRVDVRVSEDGTQRTWAAVREILQGATGLPERARQRALNVFAGLAAAEGRIHGLPADEVHFHEVGGVDAIIDVVGTCLALETARGVLRPLEPRGGGHGYHSRCSRRAAQPRPGRARTSRRGAHRRHR